MAEEKRGVLAVVVTYNRLELLKKCVSALEAQTAGCDILLVDNASTDGTEAYGTGKQGSGVFYVRLKENTGGAGGFQYGVKWGTERGYEHLWLMDDDTLPEPDALAKLLEAGEALGGKYGWLSSMALWTDGKLCGMNRQKKTPFRDVKDEDFREERVPCGIASFVSLLVRRETVIKYGYPIKEFFIWTDDWEYTRRISRGEECYLIPGSRVVHAMKQNTVSNIARDSLERLPRYRHMYRNEVYVYRREGLKGWLWVIAKDGWHSLQVVLLRHSHKGEALKTIWSGLREGIRFRPEPEGYRQGDR